MQLTDKQLSAHLNKHPALPISLITGDVPLLIQEAATKIRHAAQLAGYEQRELFFIENNQDWLKVQQAIENFNLFSQKSFIEIRQCKTKFDEVGISILSTFLQTLPDDKRLLIITDKLTAAQQKTAWIQSIDRHGVIVSIRHIYMNKLPAWISERLKQAHLKADHDSIQLLAELTEGNLLATQQAIEKLHLLYPQQTIDKKAVAAVTTDNTHFSIFDLTNYILQGAHTRVIQVLASLHFAGTETTLILWVLARELRLLYELALEKQQGKSLAQRLASQWASRKILLQKTLARLSIEKIRTLLQTAEQIDHIIKGMAPGNVWHALERLSLAMTGITL